MKPSITQTWCFRLQRFQLPTKIFPSTKETRFTTNTKLSKKKPSNSQQNRNQQPFAKRCKLAAEEFIGSARRERIIYERDCPMKFFTSRASPGPLRAEIPFPVALQTWNTKAEVHPPVLPGILARDTAVPIILTYAKFRGRQKPLWRAHDPSAMRRKTLVHFYPGHFYRTPAGANKLSALQLYPGSRRSRRAEKNSAFWQTSWTMRAVKRGTDPLFSVPRSTWTSRAHSSTTAEGNFSPTRYATCNRSCNFVTPK